MHLHRFVACGTRGDGAWSAVPDDIEPHRIANPERTEQGLHLRPGSDASSVDGDQPVVGVKPGPRPGAVGNPEQVRNGRLVRGAIVECLRWIDDGVDIVPVPGAEDACVVPSPEAGASRRCFNPTRSS